jgi:hypothetical protein
MRFRSDWSFSTAWLALATVVAMALPAGAVIIDTGDGTGNTSAPPACPSNPVCDPGWDHVGNTAGNLSVVYLRNRWVLTANHVASDTVILDGVPYAYVSGTSFQLDNGDGTFPDLKVFGITPDPGLPELAIRSNTNLPSNEVIMIGNGRNRGAATDSDDPAMWQAPPEPPAMPIPGWLWGAGRTKRWGVNVVEGDWLPDPFDTISFFTVFDYPTAPNYVMDEAQAASGDSGGAVFAKQGNSWELAGIMFLIALWDGHLNNSVLRDEVTIVADLSFYRDQILTLTEAEPVPEPHGLGGLGAGLALLATLGRRRMRP